MEMLIKTRKVEGYMKMVFRVLVLAVTASLFVGAFGDVEAKSGDLNEGIKAYCIDFNWGELMDGPFPGKGKVTKAQEMEFARRSVDRCWQSIRRAAKSVKPDCIIWLSLYKLSHPQVVNSRVIKEVDWLMNEGGTPEELKEIRKKLGRGGLINCLAAWNKADPRTVVPASLKAGFGLYGFTKPRTGSLLPGIDDYYLAKDIDELTGDEANIAMLARAYRGIGVPPSATALSAF